MGLVACGICGGANWGMEKEGALGCWGAELAPGTLIAGAEGIPSKDALGGATGAGVGEG